MKNLDKIKKLLRKHEGSSLQMYKCPEGKYTIGVGHNIEDRGISEEVEELLLQQDIDIAEKQVKNAISCYDTLNEARQYVLVDMCFNMGITKLMSFKRMLRALELGDYKKASDEMKDSKWHSQVKSRAIDLERIMITGVF